MKQKIKKEQKARGARHSRGSNTKKAKGSGGNSNFSADLQTGLEWTLGILAPAAAVALVVIFFPIEAVAAAGAALFGGITALFSL